MRLFISVSSKQETLLMSYIFTCSLPDDDYFSISVSTWQNRLDYTIFLLGRWAPPELPNSFPKWPEFQLSSTSAAPTHCTFAAPPQYLHIIHSIWIAQIHRLFVILQSYTKTLYLLLAKSLNGGVRCKLYNMMQYTLRYTSENFWRSFRYYGLQIRKKRSLCCSSLLSLIITE